VRCCFVNFSLMKQDGRVKKQTGVEILKDRGEMKWAQKTRD